MKYGFTVPGRGPLATPESLATIDVLPSGRLVVGVGTGWMEDFVSKVWPRV